MWKLILVFLLALGGFWLGKTPLENLRAFLATSPEKEFPVSERQSFVVVIYAHNQALWCERALRSVFEQEYEPYRIVLIDDASTDWTAEKASQFIVDNNQGEKVLLICNEAKLGQTACLSRATESCLDREIVVSLDAKDWLASPMVLTHLNAAYQNRHTWAVLAQAVDYPSYEIREGIQVSCYAALFKQASEEFNLPEKRICRLQEPLFFSNSVSR